MPKEVDLLKFEVAFHRKMRSAMLTNMHILRACSMIIGSLILARSTVSSSCNQIQFSRQLLVTFQGRPGKTTDKMVKSLQLSFLKAYNNVSTCGVGNFRQLTSVNVTRNVVASYGYSFNNQSSSYFVTQDFTWAIKVQGVCQGCNAQTFQLFMSDPTASTSNARYPSAAATSPTCNCPAPRKSTFLQALNRRSLLPSSIDAVLAITLLFAEPTCSSKIGQFNEYFVVNYRGGIRNKTSAANLATQTRLLTQLTLETYNNLNALNTAGVCDTQFRRYTNIQLVKSSINGASRLLLEPSHQHRQLVTPSKKPTAKPTQPNSPTSCTYGASGKCSGPCPPGKSFNPDNVNPPSHRALNMKRNEKKEDKAIPIPTQVVVPIIETNNNVVTHQSFSTDEKERIDSRHRSLPAINGKCYCQASTVARRLPFRSEFIKALNNRLQVIGPRGAGVITIVSEVDGIDPL